MSTEKWFEISVIKHIENDGYTCLRRGPEREDIPSSWEEFMEQKPGECVKQLTAIAKRLGYVLTPSD
jgi:hypothetical protein